MRDFKKIKGRHTWQGYAGGGYAPGRRHLKKGKAPKKPVRYHQDTVTPLSTFTKKKHTVNNAPPEPQLGVFRRFAMWMKRLFKK